MEEIIEKAKKGDNQAFTVLIINMQSELYKIAKLRLKSDDIAEVSPFEITFDFFIFALLFFYILSFFHAKLSRRKTMRHATSTGCLQGNTNYPCSRVFTFCSS